MAPEGHGLRRLARALVARALSGDVMAVAIHAPDGRLATFADACAEGLRAAVESMIRREPVLARSGAPASYAVAVERLDGRGRRVVGGFVTTRAEIRSLSAEAQRRASAPRPGQARAPGASYAEGFAMIPELRPRSAAGRSARHESVRPGAARRTRPGVRAARPAGFV